LPDEHFWEQMKNLQILNLHDNGIAKLESVRAIASCPNLVAMTLYDTPLSLKYNYRYKRVGRLLNSLYSYACC